MTVRRGLVWLILVQEPPYWPLSLHLQVTLIPEQLPAMLVLALGT